MELQISFKQQSFSSNDQIKSIFTLEEARHNYQDALQHYQDATINGNNIDAWYALGNRLDHLHFSIAELSGSEKKNTNFKHELMVDDCYMKAAEQDHPEAAKAMGMRYAGRVCSWSMNPPFKTPYEHAVDFFEIATKNQNVSYFDTLENEFRDIRATLGFCDYRICYLPNEIEMFQAAANAGLPHALFELGVMQSEGAINVPQDKIKGIENLTQAAEKVNFNPAFLLACQSHHCFEQKHVGESSEKKTDEEKTIEFYKMVFRMSKRRDAVYDLGRLYQSRIDIFPDEQTKKQAVFCHLIAATGSGSSSTAYLADKALQELGIETEWHQSLLDEMMAEQRKKATVERFFLLNAGINRESVFNSQDVNFSIKEKLVKSYLSDV